MLKDLNIAHLTGEDRVIENGFFSDSVQKNVRPRRSLAQMFFKPYESKEEFIYCGRRTLFPAIDVAVGVFFPYALALNYSIIISFGLLALLAGGINKYQGNSNDRICFSIADKIFTNLAQRIINTIILPLSILIMITRSLSTGLKAAGIYNFDAPVSRPAHQIYIDDNNSDKSFDGEDLDYVDRVPAMPYGMGYF